MQRWKLARYSKVLTPARILVIGFGLLILLGGLLLSLPIASKQGTGLPLLDALFTATSAVCVTGLVVVDTGTYFSTFGQLVILFLIQIGGLGFMTVATFLTIFTGKRIGLKERLILQQALNVDSLEGLIRLARNVVLLTLGIEAFFATVLAVRFSAEMPPLQAIYYGVFHAITAFCNAGFDLFGDFKSLADYVTDPTVNIAIISSIILGGLGFVVMVDIGRLMRKQRMSLHSKLVLVMTTALLVVGMLGYYLFENENPHTLGALSDNGKWLASLFASTTARTAGYASINYELITEGGGLWTMILMFIGASPGSTGGGIKTVTALAILLYVWTVMTNKENTVVFKRSVSKTVIYKSLVIAVMSSLTIAFAVLVLSVTENVTLDRLLFEVTSAFSTTGLSMNLTPTLSPAGRVIIIIMMFIGRLGPLTLALALAARRPDKANVKYPEGNLYVG